jgi:DNA-binding transcriptional MerR regulator
MTAMTKANQKAIPALTVGQVAEQLGVTVRTLHHYDEIGLLVPTGRSSAGYRLYNAEDIARLQHVVVYRRLGFSLEEIAVLLKEQAAANGDAVIGHLRRQRAAVLSRLDEMRDLVTAIDRALEKEMSGIKLTKEEQKELFGDGFSEDDAEEAEQRWGETEAWKQSQRRTLPTTTPSSLG